MDEARLTHKGDLHRVAAAYMAGDLGYAEFRSRLIDVWDRLSRVALTELERKTWGELLSAARETAELPSEGAKGFALFDAMFFKESAQSLLDSDGAEPPPPRVRRARQIQREIADILLKDWDPIGIQEFPEASDEYDSYVGQVYRMIASGAEAVTIAQHLKTIEVSLMGLGASDPDRTLAVAQKLIAINVKL